MFELVIFSGNIHCTKDSAYQIFGIASEKNVIFFSKRRPPWRLWGLRATPNWTVPSLLARYMWLTRRFSDFNGSRRTARKTSTGLIFGNDPEFDLFIHFEVFDGCFVFSSVSAISPVRSTLLLHLHLVSNHWLASHVTGYCPGKSDWVVCYPFYFRFARRWRCIWRSRKLMIGFLSNTVFKVLKPFWVL